MGKWIKINGEAIYSTRPAETYGENGAQIRFTRNKENTVIYIFSTDWLGDNALLNIAAYNSAKLNSAKISKITMLGNGVTSLKWSQNATALTIKMPSAKPVACNYCYVFKVKLKSKLQIH